MKYFVMFDDSRERYHVHKAEENDEEIHNAYKIRSQVLEITVSSDLPFSFVSREVLHDLQCPMLLVRTSRMEISQRKNSDVEDFPKI